MLHSTCKECDDYFPGDPKSYHMPVLSGGIVFMGCASGRPVRLSWEGGREAGRKVSKSELEKNHLTKHLGAKFISFSTALGKNTAHILCQACETTHTTPPTPSEAGTQSKDTVAGMQTMHSRRPERPHSRLDARAAPLHPSHLRRGAPGPGRHREAFMGSSPPYQENRVWVVL